ncbi:hypothetical protein [Lacipirellula sp.]|uniref:hypothetical protein n=1 Tax=Lacipirellula sp. TaxID=2691419 RepID=UPI003D0D0A0F
MSAISSACITVAKGGVGESGASSFIAHKVGQVTSKMMVVRNVHSDLCGNTGAFATLIINGLPSASGLITAQGSTIQAEAPIGAHVALIVHTLPLFNGIFCNRLGELYFRLDECDLVAVKANGSGDDAYFEPRAAVTADWYAWNDLSPPKPDDFFVTGEVEVANPGVEVLLVPKVPQGFNPRILLMELIFIQRPGIWPALVVKKPVRYHKANATYDWVEIYIGGNQIANIQVVTVV